MLRSCADRDGVVLRGDCDLGEEEQEMTNREKQIEEMAKLACSVFDGNCMGCSFAIYPPCPPKASAERLYNAGYRKQSEGEWRIVHENNISKVAECTNCKESFLFMKKGQLNIDRMPRCPKCGAKMKGGK